MFNLRALFRPKPLTDFERAVRLLDAGALEQALTAFGALLLHAQDPRERAAILNKRGVAQICLGRREQAVQDFTQALESCPAYAPATVNLGNVLLEDGNLQAAIEHYETAIRYDDGYAVAHLNLGVAYKRAGRTDEGVRELRRATNLERRPLSK